MKTFIRQRATGAFLTFQGKWTQDRNEAWPVPYFMDPFALAERIGERDLEIFYSYSDESAEHLDFAVPVRGLMARGDRGLRHVRL